MIFLLTPKKQKLGDLSRVQSLRFPRSYNPHFGSLRLRGVNSKESVSERTRERKERKERERREKSEKKREKERTKMEKKKEKELKKMMKIPSKRANKEIRKEIKRGMQMEWEEELERERERSTLVAVSLQDDVYPGGVGGGKEAFEALNGHHHHHQDDSAIGSVMVDQVELRARLDKLLQLPENKTCADCGAQGT